MTSLIFCSPLSPPPSTTVKSLKSPAPPLTAPKEDQGDKTLKKLNALIKRDPRTNEAADYWPRLTLLLEQGKGILEAEKTLKIWDENGYALNGTGFRNQRALKNAMKNAWDKAILESDTPLLPALQIIIREYVHIDFHQGKISQRPRYRPPASQEQPIRMPLLAECHPQLLLGLRP